MIRWTARAGALATAVTLAACTTTPPPPPPTPPAPVIVLPAPPPMARPVAPGQAADNLVIPVTDLAGRRLTPNVDLGPEQALWQLRIGLNVAALNCRGPAEQILVDNYSAFLTNNQAAIARAERVVIAEQGRLNGTNGIAARDALSTRLYNYFAQPPVQESFCPIAFNLAGLAAVEPVETILPFAQARLPELDRPFVDFYNAYDQYQRDFAVWQAMQPAPLMPAYVPPSAAQPAMFPPMTGGR